MTIYNIHIFDRNGTCLYYYEWNRKKQAGMSREEEFKLMYGMIFSIKSFIARMSPTDYKDGFTSFRTNKYKLNFYETPSGLKFILTTDLSVGNTRDVLQQIYSQIFVEFVVKNPLCSLGEPITSELFKIKLDNFVRGLPYFQIRPT
ncbi:trafficking protein particle complex subunit 1-like [Glandiceps talaboti]